MRIKCVTMIDEATQEKKNISHSLTIGKEYIVLAITMYPAKNYFQLVGDNENKSPTLHNAKQFEITSSRIPSNWQINADNFAIALAPKGWEESGFWEKCFGGDEPALEIYKREVKIIYEEEGVY